MATPTLASIQDVDWPLFGLVDDLRPALAEALAVGPAILATIIAVEGGGPRPVGSQMVFGARHVAGFLSGGCIESDVEGHALACLQDGQPRHLVYGQGSPWPDIRLMCGARIEILVERVGPDDLAAAALAQMTHDRVPCLWISDGRQRRCAPVARAGKIWPGAFARLFTPAWRLIVVGGDPTALATADLGAQSGFATTLVRPKGPATPPPLDKVAYHRGAPSQALSEIGLDLWTAVAVCGHDLELDHQALLTALASSAPYVGLLGARRRLDERLARLQEAGLSPRQLARLRAPIGLDLGAKAPMAIAVAIIGEILQACHLAGELGALQSIETL